ncbi:MAG: amidase [Thermoleophilaceae bacterium]
MELIERSAVDLARAIREGELSARAVVEAHIDQARRVNPAICALVADRFDAALEEADAADARVRAGGELPPLLGVPCTIKESFALEGMPNCAGLVSRREQRADRDAPAVARLRAAGAIPIGVTNTSELTMWIESHNRVYGRTRNAYDPRRTAGGSSGGEGAAIGAGMAPIGLGTDIGGSIRLPAFFNGVFGHKPSPGLVPCSGHFPAPAGEGAARMLAAGPLARRAEDLMPFLRAVAGKDGDDPVSRDGRLQDPAAVELDGLEVVVSEGASLIPVRGELRDARERAAGALAAAGARIRRVRLTGLRRSAEFFLATLREGAGADLLEIFTLEEAPRLRRVLLDSVRRRGEHTMATALLFAADGVAERIPAGYTRRAIGAGKALRAELDEVIGDGVLLHPPFPRVAPRHSATVGRPWVVANAAVFNMTGHPVTQVPLGLGRKGLPVGVQVAAGHDRDHVAIAVALELERSLGGWVRPG